MKAAQVRTWALALPEATEVVVESWGHPTFRVNDKIFCSMASDGSTVGVKASKEEQAALIAADPDTFSPSDYVGRHGWTTIVAARVDPDELHELIIEAWRHIAPKRLVKSYDAAAG